MDFAVDVLALAPGVSINQNGAFGRSASGRVHGAASEQIEFYGRIENLLDEHYQQILGYGTPGLSGTVGARLNI